MNPFAAFLIIFLVVAKINHIITLIEFVKSQDIYNWKIFSYLLSFVLLMAFPDHWVVCVLVLHLNLFLLLEVNAFLDGLLLQ